MIVRLTMPEGLPESLRPFFDVAARAIHDAVQFARPVVLSKGGEA